MNWAHLPHDGGLFNQNPTLLERFWYIFQERAKEEERKQNEREREQDRRASRMRRGASRGR